MILASSLALGLLGAVPAQDGMPVIPPPWQRRGEIAETTIEDLVRQGFEVKAMDRSGAAGGRWLVMLQRQGEVRTCLMRFEPRGEGAPARRTACF